MKKVFLVFLFSLFLIGSSWCQFINPFAATEITWYGLDFTKSKMVGNFAQFKDAGFKDGYDIRNNYFTGWNRVIINEPEKYTLSKFFNVPSVKSTLRVTDEINRNMDPSKLMMDYYVNELSAEELQGCINNYKLEETSGVGLVFIIEKFDKTEERGYMHVVYFDIASKKVLFSKRMSGAAMGFGIKNYWIRTVYNVMNDVSSQQRQWRKNYK